MEKEKNIFKVKPYKLFQTNNNKFVYVIDNGAFYKIDSITNRLLKNEGKTFDEIYSLFAKEKEELTKIIDAMKANEFIISDTEKEKNMHNKTSSAFKSKIQLKGITLMVAQDCNLRCTYCYGDSGEYNDRGLMTEEVAINAVDFLIDNCGESKELLVVFFGGEPLLNYNLIVNIVEYCNQVSNKYGYKFNFSTTTNGTMLNEKIEKFLRENKIATQISIDGTEIMQNSNRIYADGTGSYASVIEKTEKMRKDKLLSARATISRTNLDLISVFEHLEGLGFKSIPISPAQNLLSEEEYKKLSYENKKLINLFEKLIKNNEFDKASKMRILWSALNKIHNSSKRNHVCGAGINTLTIDRHGNLFPCHRYVGITEYIVGHVNNGMSNQQSFIDLANVDNQEQCNDCWVKNLCCGACTNENYYATNDIQISSEKNCKYTEKFFTEMIYLYLNLTEVEKEIIFKKVK